MEIDFGGSITDMNKPYPSSLGAAPGQFNLLNIQTDLIKLMSEVMMNAENLAAEVCGSFPVATMDKKESPHGLASMLASGMQTQRELLDRINSHLNMIRSSL
jgi:hypothetical protein